MRGRTTSASATFESRLWDAATGTETAHFKGHSGFAIALCVLPDGRLASGSGDNTIRLWDVATGTETARLEVDAPVGCLTALSSNHLVAGDNLGRLH